MKKKDTTPTVIDITQELTTVATETGMQLTEAQNIGAAFAPFMEKVNELTVKINAIPTENPSIADAALARKLRLELVSNRGKNGLGGVHKDFKAAVLVRQRAIDGLNNFVENSSKIAELRAEGIEKHSERVENARLDEVERIRLERLNEIESEPKYGVNIRLMDDETFEGYFNNEKLIQDAVKRDNEAREESERKAASLVKDRTKLLVDAGFIFDGDTFYVINIPSTNLEDLKSLKDEGFNNIVESGKKRLEIEKKEKDKKDAELAAFKKQEEDKKALLLSRFNTRSDELVKAGFQFVSSTKMFTHTETAHDNIPSSSIVNMEDKPWKEYLKSVLDVVNEYKRVTALKDKFKESAIESLLENGFIDVGKGFTHDELDWFIPSESFSGFADNDGFNTWYSQIKLQHAKLTQAKIDADAAKLQREKDERIKLEADKLSKGTDQQKVTAFYSQFKDFKFPNLTSDAGKSMELKINSGLEELRKLIISEAKGLV